MATEDLWGDLPKVDTIKTPLVILKEQGELLSKKTNGLLVCDIKQRKASNKFIYEFYIVAPTLNDYTYPLVVIHHGIGLYPVRLTDPQSGHKPTTCENENDFKQVLKTYLTSEKTQDVISKLLSHIKAIE